MNKKIWITNSGKIRRKTNTIKRLEVIYRLREILVEMKSMEECRLVYTNRKEKRND